MHTSLVGTTLRLLKPTMVIIASGERGSLTSLAGGEALTIKAPAKQKPGLLVAAWRGNDVLVFEQDLQNAHRAKRIR